ncbi:MAG: hypothetical protein AMK73_01800 [Planctomycetes bacterium SM23_32]|nr:MAG: hypothetical protein AMK73_01800 [Planctomycetes bacterium SM23_32]
MSIEHYAFGMITIDGQTCRSDVIIWPEGVDDSWWRVEGHSLCREDLEPVFAHGPEVLVIGTGAHGAMQVPPEVVRHMVGRCGEVHVERTAKAVALYNELSGGGRRVVAALHLTC